MVLFRLFEPIAYQLQDYIQVRTPVSLKHTVCLYTHVHDGILATVRVELLMPDHFLFYD